MQENAKEVSNLLKTMAHPDRLMVLCQLIDGEMSVAELQQNSTLSQSAFSQHLKVLKSHGLICDRKSSQQVFYSLADSNIAHLIGTLHELYCPKP